MNKEKLKTLLLAMASINHMLIQETKDDPCWNAITDEMNYYIQAGGVELESLYRQAALADADTEEFAPVIVENIAETRELPAVVVYDGEGRMVS